MKHVLLVATNSAPLYPNDYVYVATHESVAELKKYVNKRCPRDKYSMGQWKYNAKNDSYELRIILRASASIYFYRIEPIW